MSAALVLLAHGSREPEWAQPVQQLREALAREKPGHPVALAFLEFTVPSLQEVADELAVRGVRTMRVLPLFLGLGNHLRRDLPALCESIRKRHPALSIELLPSLGEQSAVLEGLARSIAHVCSTARPDSTSQDD